MTAEVLILNKTGVAMAADSAVSIGTRKIYNSANKLFSLSRSQPVGIMIYGSAQFMGVPWEALIKCFRKNVLKNDVYKTLQEYSDKFMSFLASTALVPTENEIDYVNTMIHTQVYDLVKQIDTKAKAHIAQYGAITKAETKNLAAEEAKQWIAKATPRKDLAKCSLKQKRAIEQNYKKVIDDFVAKTLTMLGIQPAVRREISNLMVVRLTIRDTSFRRSGVVIAGFGDLDIFPGAISYQISGRVCGFLRANESGKHAVSESMQASIIPFAQREMVDTFMCGFDPSFSRAIDEGIRKIFQELPSGLFKKNGLTLTKSQSTAISKDLNDLLDNFSKALKAIQSEKFAAPVLDSVAALPIDELASMAESLVSLTSFKRKVTMVPESVGGPVDVAVISKGDGFIWIKRKHYFKPELNSQYFRTI